MIRWAEEIGDPTCPYIRRWVFNFGFFSLRVHHWLSSDDLRYPHDHPWWYLSLILAGGYTDVSPTGNDTVKPGSLRFRRATHQHSVKVNPGGCWSILLTGREIRTWGFWVNGRLRKRNKYFYEHGHHPCDGNTSPFRPTTRPRVGESLWVRLYKQCALPFTKRKPPSQDNH